MEFGKEIAPPSGKNLLIIGAFLALLAYFAYFRRFSEFGFYGDDHAFFGGLINRDWKGELSNVWFCLSKWPQGRPLGMGLNLNLVPYLIFHAAGLGGLYVIAFLIVVANCILIYRLVAHFHPPIVAVSAAGFYALAPADTVQISLVYAYNFEIAILFGILSALAALRGRPFLFATTLIASLLMVEPVAMFPLIAPLFLTIRRERSWLFWAGRHLVIWIGAILTVLIARRLIGDPWGSERVSEIAAMPLIVLQHGLTSAFTGFRTHFALVLERLIQPFNEADSGLCLAMLGTGGITAVTTWLLWSKMKPSESGRTEDKANWQPGGRLLLAGCVIMLTVYFCYFRTPWYPANWRTGFMSGVHVVAAVGSCLVFGALVSLVVTALPQRFKPATGALLVLVFASLTGFGTLVQRDYANSWAFQKKFWQAYAKLCPDAGDRTYILVLDRNLPHLRYIDLFSWGAEILPGALFEYRNLALAEDHSILGTEKKPTVVPTKLLGRPPSVIFTAPDPTTAIKCIDGKYAWKPTYYFMLPKTPNQQPESGNTIILAYDDHGIWQRINGDVKVDGGVLQLKSPGEVNVLQRAHKTPLAAVYGL